MYKRENIVGLVIGVIYFFIVSFLEYVMGTAFRKILIVDLLIIFILLLFFIPKLQLLIKRIIIRYSPCRIKIWKVFMAFFLFAIAVLMILFFAVNPGCFSPDSVSQYDQAVTGNYSDWHPVIHTLLFFTFPLKVTGLIESIFIWQALIFSAAVAFLCSIIWKYSNAGFAVISFLWILVNPFTIQILVYPWKDNAIAIFASITMAIVVEIYFTDGDFFKKKWVPIVLGLMLALCSLIRHNGILFAFPVLLAVMLYGNKKTNILLVVSFVLFFISVKGPLYTTLDVEKPEKRVTETVGLPLTIIGNVVVNKAQKLDNEVLEYVYSIASPEEWERYYSRGNFNNLKFQTTTDTSIVDEKGYKGVFEVTIKCIKAGPGEAIRGFIALTELVYGVRRDSIHPIGGIWEWESNSDMGIISHSNKNLIRFINVLLAISSNSLLGYIFYSIGIFNAVLVACIIGKVDFQTRKGRKVFWLSVPLLCYNFGTMFLLTGFDTRFFYLNVTTIPGFLLILLGKKPGESIISEA